MKLSSISNSFFKLCSFDKELLDKTNRRPYLMVLKLKYKGKKLDFAIPFRSNISASTPKEQYFPLPPRPKTKKYNKHGLHYIKMFPITKQYLEKFYTDKDPYYQKIDSIIINNKNVIISEAQKYLDDYANGNINQYATDIDSIILAIHGTPSIIQEAAVNQPDEITDNSTDAKEELSKAIQELKRVDRTQVDSKLKENNT